MSENIHEEPQDAAPVSEPTQPAWLTGLAGLPAMVAELAQARRDLEQARMGSEMAFRAVEKSGEYIYWQELAKKVDAAVAAVLGLDAQVRKQAIEDFKSVGEKALLPGVNIKMFTKVEYDPKAMRDWAKEHMTSLLTLDVKGVEVAAKAGILDDDAPIVVRKEPRVLIANDLSVYLGEQP